MPENITNNKSNTASNSKVNINIYRAHTNKVSSIDFCHSDRHFLSASFDHSIILWDAHTSRIVHRFEGHHAYISCARLSKDERFFVTAGWDRKMVIWDIETGSMLRQAYHGGIVTSAHFNSDGNYIISGNDIDYRINIWDARDCKISKTLRDIHTNTPTKCVFTPDETRIISSAMDYTSKVYDLKADKITLSFTDHRHVISSLDITKDERKVATSSWDKSVHVYDISTGSYRHYGPHKLLGEHEGCISCCRFSDDGRLLISGGFDNNIVLWDMDDMKRELKLQGHEDWIEDVAFSKDGKWVLSCSKDSTIRRWNIENRDLLPTVMESRLNAGAKILKCVTCGKPFTFTLESFGQKCVFCRVSDPDQSNAVADITSKFADIANEDED